MAQPKRNWSLEVLRLGAWTTDEYDIGCIHTETSVEDVAQDMAAIVLDSDSSMVNFNFAGYQGNNKDSYYQYQYSKFREIIQNLQKYDISIKEIDENEYYYDAPPKTEIKLECRRKNI